MSDNKKRTGFNSKAYKYAIGMVESAGGKYLENKTSSAAGRYQFLYNLIKKDPEMKGVTKRQFINNPNLQERIMDKALSGNLAGFTYGEKYANKLKKEFNSEYDVNSLTAMVHFLGAGNARKFLKDPVNFRVPGAVNLTGDEYLNKFKKHFDSYNRDNSPNNNLPDNIDLKNINQSEMLQSNTEVDNTYTNAPQELKTNPATDFAQAGEYNQNSIPQQNSMPPQTDSYDFIDEYRGKDTNDFNQGGQMTGQSSAEQLVTLFEAGGSHEQNPLGGIPQGVGANGKTNLVEEGETKWNDYIFSNAYSLDGSYTGEDGNKSNVFEDGGELDPPNGNPVSNIKPDLPRTFPKSEMQPNAYGGLEKVTQNFELPDVRKQHMPNDNYVSANPNEDIDFQSQVKGEGSQKFLDRYNDPTTRKMMKDQTGLSDEDIDNMILKGLSADKVIGGNTGGSKGSYDHEENTIHMGEEHKDDTGAEVHETVHASLFDSAQGQNLMDVLGSPFEQEGKESMMKSQMGRDVLGYMKKPHEAYGNFSEFREKIGLKPGEQITEEELKKRAKDKGLTNENFYRSFNNKNITKALNTVAYQSIDNDINNYKLS